MFLFLILLVGCGKSDLSKDVIKNVEDAYDRASTSGTPTLQQVKSNFKMDNASWLADQIICNEGLACDISVQNKVLVVQCPNLKSEKNMILK